MSNIDVLQNIQHLQFQDKRGAEALLLSFMKELFPQLNIIALELRPQAISLNSFNGFLTLANGTRLFFKSHTESDTVIHEYYRAELLQNAGYPVIQPIYKSTEVGKQVLIYEVIEEPSVFDLAWDIENNKSNQIEILTQAQNQSDDKLLELYIQSLERQDAKLNSEASIHQLFYHRIVGGRLDRFYGVGTSMQTPGGKHSLEHIRKVNWIINGQEYKQSLNEIIQLATRILNPIQEGMSIVGHGDAHNGNVFFVSKGHTPELLYFDPAFAGRHHPILDLTKPLFHNVFAMWMYFPFVKEKTTSISLKIDEDQWHVNYDYDLHPVRTMFLESKVERVLIPTLQELKQRGELPENWRQFLKLALFCCPFLTMNLADNDKFPESISLLGICMSVEMGAESFGENSLIDQILDQVSDSL